MQLALRPDPTGLDRGAGPSPSASRMNQIFVAGVALIGASLIAVNPGTPSLPNVQHRLVQLTAGEADWSQVLAAPEDNLTTLESDATTANSDLSMAIGAEFGGYGDQLSTALSNVETNLGDILCVRAVRGIGDRSDHWRYRDREHAARDRDRSAARQHLRCVQLLRRRCPTFSAGSLACKQPTRSAGTDVSVPPAPSRREWDAIS